MKKNVYENFNEEYYKLFEKYVNKYQKDYAKKKDYKSIAKRMLDAWFEKFGPSLVDLEILRKFSIALKENEEVFEQCTDEEKYFINLVVDNLDCTTVFTNSILEIVYKIIQKL